MSSSETDIVHPIGDEASFGNALPNPESRRNRFRRRAARALTLSVLAIYLVFGALVAAHTHNLIGLSGAPIGYDFTTFYESAQFAKNGHAADAYDDEYLIAAVDTRFPGNTVRLPWNYPPTFLLLLLPLAILPYLAAWIAWSTITYGAYAALVRSICRSRWLGPMLLFPGAALNLVLGQNGLLSLSLIGGGVLLIKPRPVIAGILLGLASYKPHLAFLIPLVLLLSRERKAFVAMAASGAAIILLSMIAFGFDPWIDFLAKSAHASTVVASSSSSATNIPSVFVIAQTFGLPFSVAFGLHAAAAAAALFLCLITWRRTDDVLARAGSLACAALLATPYLRSYDMALLALPIATLATTVHRSTLRYALIAASWLMPFAAVTAPICHYGIATLVTAACLLTIHRDAVNVKGAAVYPDGEDSPSP